MTNIYNFITAFVAFSAAILSGLAVNGIDDRGHFVDELSRLDSYMSGLISNLNVSRELHLELGEILKRTFKILEDDEIVKDLKRFKKWKRLPDDADAKRNASELIQSKGFRSEEYYVTTADGFILSIVRVLPALPVSPKSRAGRKYLPALRKSPNSTRLPVFLLHGLLSSCDCFINNMRDQSLAFILVDHGYDVWMGNVRGNRYSTKHQSLTPKDKKFWKWSFDEIGMYDVPVMVDFVLSQTGFAKLDYIGHSEGTTNLITSVIAHGGQISQKINRFLALAPAIYVSHSKGILKDLAFAARIIQKTWDLVEDGDVFAHDEFIALLGQKYCYDFPWLCLTIVEGMVGPGLAHFNESRIPVYLSHAPAGTSTQNMVHWSQQCEGGDKLVYYDYGSRWANWEHYHQMHPPVYDLQQFTVPTYAFLGTGDWLVRPVDGNKTVEDLPNVKWKKIYKGYSHIDFVWGYNVADTLIRDILDILST